MSSDKQESSGFGFLDTVQKEFNENFNQYVDAFKKEYYDKSVNYTDISPERKLSLSFILILLFTHVFVYSSTNIRGSVFGSLPWLMILFMGLITLAIPLATLMYPEEIKQKQTKLAIVGIGVFFCLAIIYLIALRNSKEGFTSSNKVRSNITEGFNTAGTTTTSNSQNSTITRDGINVISVGRNFFDDDGLVRSEVQTLFQPIMNHITTTHTRNRVTLGQILGQDTTDTNQYLPADLVRIGRDNLTASHFWICSSYKTALPLDKRQGPVSAEAIFQAIRLGARLIWLDILKREIIRNVPITGQRGTRRELIKQAVIGAGIEYHDGIIQSQNTITLANAFAAIRAARNELSGDDSRLVSVRRRRDPIFVFLALRINNDDEMERQIAAQIKETFSHCLLPESYREMQTSLASVPLVNFLGSVIFISDRVPRTPELSYYINYVACGKHILEMPGTDIATYNNAISCDMPTTNKQGSRHLSLVNKNNFPIENYRTGQNNYLGTNNISIVIPDSEQVPITDPQELLLGGSSFVTIPFTGNTPPFNTATRTYFDRLFINNQNIINRQQDMLNPVFNTQWSFSQGSFIPKRHLTISVNGNTQQLIMYKTTAETIIPGPVPQNRNVDHANSKLDLP